MNTTDKALVNRARGLLSGMGNNPGEVADFLRRKSIKGIPDDPHEDPVCRYLKAELGTDDVAIEFGSAFVNSRGGWSPETGLPNAVDDFLGLFDAEQYPDLIDKS